MVVSRGNKFSIMRKLSGVAGQILQIHMLMVIVMGHRIACTKLENYWTKTLTQEVICMVLLVGS